MLHGLLFVLRFALPSILGGRGQLPGLRYQGYLADKFFLESIFRQMMAKSC